MYLFYYLPIFVRNKYKRKKTHQLHTNIQSQTQYFVKQNCDKNYDNFVLKKIQQIEIFWQSNEYHITVHRSFEWAAGSDK